MVYYIFIDFFFQDRKAISIHPIGLCSIIDQCLLFLSLTEVNSLLSGETCLYVFNNYSCSSSLHGKNNFKLSN